MFRGLNKLSDALAWFSGAAPARWRRLARQAGGLTAVLCYHRVVDDASRRGAGAAVRQGIPRRTLQAQMHFMLRHFTPVLPWQAAQPAEAGRLRFAVTFDDGYDDNFHLAAPLLRGMGVPAGFYVVSECVGQSQAFWWDRLNSLFSTARVPRLEVAALAQVVPGLGGAVPGWHTSAVLRLDSADARAQANARVEAALRRAHPAQIEPALQGLRALLDAPPPPTGLDRLMDWDHLRSLHTQGFEIGSHSADHLNLGALEAPTLMHQLARSKAHIEQQLGAPVRTLAYPYGGAANVNAQVMALAAQCGYSAAFTALPGLVGAAAQPYALPRLSLNWPWGFACAHNLNQALRRGAPCAGASSERVWQTGRQEGEND